MAEDPRPAPPPWSDPANLINHFNDHGRELGFTSIRDYEASAQETVRIGKRFTYRQGTRRIPRVGYFDPVSGRLTVLDEHETVIINHFAATESYVRRRAKSDYK